MNEKTLKNSLNKVINLIEKKITDYIPKGNLDTGFDIMDMSLYDGNLTILASTQSMGKTSLAVDITRNLAMKGKAIGYISMGESEEVIIKKLLVPLAEVPMWKVRVGNLTSDELSSLKKASDKLSGTSIFIDDICSPSLNKVIDIAKDMDSNHKLDLLVIDYLQLIEEKEGGPDYGEKRVEKIKSLARRLNIPVLLLVQAKEILKEGNNNLRMLRRIENIEKVADVIIFINRYGEDNKYAELLIEHNRLGHTGKMDLLFDPLLMTFRLLINQNTNIHMDYQQKEKLGYRQWKKFIKLNRLDDLVEPTPLAKVLLRLEEKWQRLLDRFFH
jgi:replicative DNA helicase